MGCDCSSYIGRHHVPQARGLFHKYSAVMLTLLVSICGGFREPQGASALAKSQTQLGDCLWNISLAACPSREVPLCTSCVRSNQEAEPGTPSD